MAEEKEPTKGKIFKKKSGYSKTMLRNIRKAGIDTSNGLIAVEKYKDLRKKRKKTEKIARKAKKDNIRASKKVKTAVVPNKK